MGEVSYLPLIEDMTWSYSRASSFDECPYRFFLKYIYGCEEAPMFYAEYGSFIHRLLEEFYRGNLSKDEMKLRFLTDFPIEVKGERPSQDIVENYIRKGVAYLENFEPFPFKMLDVEKKVKFKIDKYNFLGFIDYVGEDENGDIVIVDNKSRELKPRSNRKKPTAKDMELDSMLKQLYIYSKAIKDISGRLPAKLCFNCFKNQVFIEEPFRQEAYEESLEWAIKTIRDIEKTEEFYPRLDYFVCNFLCGVNEDCVFYEMERDSYRRGRK